MQGKQLSKFYSQFLLTIGIIFTAISISRSYYYFVNFKNKENRILATNFYQKITDFTTLYLNLDSKLTPNE